ncbi:hypothetical protein ABPG72_000118 [Tetrahymena utriculariae]
MSGCIILSKKDPNKCLKCKLDRILLNDECALKKEKNRFNQQKLDNQNIQHIKDSVNLSNHTLINTRFNQNNTNQINQIPSNNRLKEFKNLGLKVGQSQFLRQLQDQFYENDIEDSQCQFDSKMNCAYCRENRLYYVDEQKNKCLLRIRSINCKLQIQNSDDCFSLLCSINSAINENLMENFVLKNFLVIDYVKYLSEIFQGSDYFMTDSQKQQLNKKYQFYGINFAYNNEHSFCLECEKGFYFNSKTLKCEQNIQNCIIHSKQNTCILQCVQVDVNQQMGSIEKQFVELVQFANDKCIQCFDGYYLDIYSDNKCFIDSKFPDCKMVDQIPQNGIQIEQIDYIYQGNNQYLEKNDNYYKVLDCLIKNCLICHEGNIFLKFKYGFYQVQNKQACQIGKKEIEIIPTENIQNCLISLNDQKNCFKCKPNYFLMQDLKCYQNFNFYQQIFMDSETGNFCYKCPFARNNCVQNCPKFYKIENGQQICIESCEGLYRYENNPQECTTKCKFNYLIDEEKLLCRVCQIENCLICSKQQRNVCLKCSQNYSSKDVACIQFYQFIPILNMCQKKCDDSCQICDKNDEKCLKCNPKKYLLSGQLNGINQCFDKCPLGYYPSITAGDTNYKKLQNAANLNNINHSQISVVQQIIALNASSILIIVKNATINIHIFTQTLTYKVVQKELFQMKIISVNNAILIHMVESDSTCRCANQKVFFQNRCYAECPRFMKLIDKYCLDLNSYPAFDDNGVFERCENNFSQLDSKFCEQNLINIEKYITFKIHNNLITGQNQNFAVIITIAQTPRECYDFQMRVDPKFSDEFLSLEFKDFKIDSYFSFQLRMESQIQMSQFSQKCQNKNQQNICTLHFQICHNSLLKKTIKLKLNLQSKENNNLLNIDDIYYNNFYPQQIEIEMNFDKEIEGKLIIELIAIDWKNNYLGYQLIKF